MKARKADSCVRSSRPPIRHAADGPRVVPNKPGQRRQAVAEADHGARDDRQDRPALPNGAELSTRSGVWTSRTPGSACRQRRAVRRNRLPNALLSWCHVENSTRKTVRTNLSLPRWSAPSMRPCIHASASMRPCCGMRRSVRRSDGGRAAAERGTRVSPVGRGRERGGGWVSPRREPRSASDTPGVMRCVGRPASGTGPRDVADS